MKRFSALVSCIIFVFQAFPAVALAQDATTAPTAAATTAPTTTDSNNGSGGDVVGQATNVVNKLQKTSARISQEAARQTTQLSTLQTKADGLIAKRIASLNEILSRIQNDKRLSSDEKSTLSANVQSAISGLNALKAKIDADTTLADARTDGKQIFTTYRVYEVLMPQIRLLVMLDNLQIMVDRLNLLLPQAQTLLTTLQGQAINITTAQPALTDATTQLTAITAEITKDRATVTGVTPQTANANQILQGVRLDINSVIRPDFQKIKTDIETIRTSIAPQKGTSNTNDSGTASGSGKSILSPTNHIQTPDQ